MILFQASKIEESLVMVLQVLCLKQKYFYFLVSYNWQYMSLPYFQNFENLKLIQVLDIKTSSTAVWVCPI